MRRGTPEPGEDLTGNVTSLLEAGIITLAEARRLLGLPEPPRRSRVLAAATRTVGILVPVLLLTYVGAIGAGTASRGDPAAFLPSWLPGSPILQQIYRGLVPHRTALAPAPRQSPPTIVDPNPLPDPSPSTLRTWLGRVRQLERGFFTQHHATAFFVGPDSIITALHVISAAPDQGWSVVDHGYNVTAVNSDSGLDVVLMRPDQRLTMSPDIVFRLGSAPTARGQRVWALCTAGQARIVPLVVTSPSLPATARNLDESNGTYSREDALVLSGAAPGGCGGAPLVDASGTVVGMIEATGPDTTVALSSVDIRRWLT